MKKAEHVTEESNEFIANETLRLRLRAATFNNYGCFFRRKGKLLHALQYLEKAVVMEQVANEADNPAATHLNLCAILSELGRHKDALFHAECALAVLERQDNVTTKCVNDISILAVAHHNLAVEHEFLKQHDQAIESYAKACTIAERELGNEHPTTVAIRNSFSQAFSKIQQRKETLQQRDYAMSYNKKTSSNRKSTKRLMLPRIKDPDPVHILPDSVSDVDHVCCIIEIVYKFSEHLLLVPLTLNSW